VLARSRGMGQAIEIKLTDKQREELRTRVERLSEAAVICD
jgi:hypothetical protein